MRAILMADQRWSKWSYFVSKKPERIPKLSISQTLLCARYYC